MIFIGEITGICASLFGTASSITGEISIKRIGPLTLNLWIMITAFIMLMITLLCFTGSVVPKYMDLRAFLWIAASGVLCYLISNYYLYNAYMLIGARYSELFMTLIAPAAALTGWIMLDERLTGQELIGITVTLSGIGISLLSRGDKSKKTESRKVLIKGILFATIASIAEGVGIVFCKVGMLHHHTIMPEGMVKLDYLIPLSASYVSIFVGMIGFFLVTLFTRKLQNFKNSINDRKGFFAALITGCTGAFIGSTCEMIAVRYAKAGIAATLVELTPIMIIVPAYYLFKEKITFLGVLGTVISIFGISLFFIRF